MKEAGIDVDIVEDGTTFEENALIKAKAVAAHCNDIVLADDSGLEIDYLNKEPGIYSARYAGEDTSYDIKNQMLLDRLQGVPKEKRTARFVCAIAAVVPGHECVERLKAILVINRQEKTDLGMIRFSMYQIWIVLLRSCLRRIKMREAIVEMHCGRYEKN